MNKIPGREDVGRNTGYRAWLYGVMGHWKLGGGLGVGRYISSLLFNSPSCIIVLAGSVICRIWYYGCVLVVPRIYEPILYFTTTYMAG